MANRSVLRAAICACVALTCGSAAEGAITSVIVKTSRDFENAPGYKYAEIMVQGSVDRDDGSTGVYSVPAVIIYPRDGRGNRVGVVDWLNSGFYHFFPPTTEDGTIEFTRLATGNYLFDEGYTYISIQWNKKVTHIFGPTAPLGPHNHLVYGSIDKSADAWEILLDAARLLKDPRLYPGGDGPARVKTVLSSGYSQGGALQLELLAENRDPGRVYDGHLIQMIGLVCWKREDVEPHFGFLEDCGPLPTSGKHAPVMVLASESDMVAFQPPGFPFGKSAFFARNRSNPNWRQDEMAGISHIPAPILPVAHADQNTADARPIFRAAFANLTAWTHGRYRVKPPESRYFKGSVDANDAFIPITDRDGHFAGGVRLPHVESTVHGCTAGAPLGRHRPLNPVVLDPPDPFVFLGGTFTRFTDAELLDRYPSRNEYVSRVTIAVDSLVARRYITYKDWKALIASAKVEQLPIPPGDDDGNDFTGATPCPKPQPATSR